jgi:catechol 2,3-dioxygenase-like lactoylglutathione lyase family enzyme
MDLKLHIVTLFVSSYDQAIQYFTRTLGFVLIEDILITTSRRWVKVAPDIQSPVHIVLHEPLIASEKSLIGKQAASRPLIALSTQDLATVVKTLTNRGVVFTKPITKEIYGERAQFKDLYGNLWEIVQYDVFS